MMKSGLSFGFAFAAATSMELMQDRQITPTSALKLNMVPATSLFDGLNESASLSRPAARSYGSKGFMQKCEGSSDKNLLTEGGLDTKDERKPGRSYGSKDFMQKFEGSSGTNLLTEGGLDTKDERKPVPGRSYGSKGFMQKVEGSSETNLLTEGGLVYPENKGESTPLYTAGTKWSTEKKNAWPSALSQVKAEHLSEQLKKANVVGSIVKDLNSVLNKDPNYVNKFEVHFSSIKKYLIVRASTEYYAKNSRTFDLSKALGEARETVKKLLFLDDINKTVIRTASSAQNLQDLWTQYKETSCNFDKLM